jgi:hypothetical protein
MKELEDEHRPLMTMYLEEISRLKLFRRRLQKVVRPLQRRVMAGKAVEKKAVTIKLACQAFGVSESSYRYMGKLSDENQLIADWLLKITDDNRS